MCFDKGPPEVASLSTSWTIVRTFYCTEQIDGSVSRRVAFTCPAPGCGLEFEDLDQVTEHVETNHGVSLGHSAAERRQEGSQRNLFGRKIRCANGEIRLGCPRCILQFCDMGELKKHLSAEHGVLSGSSTETEFSDELDTLYTAPSVDWFQHRKSALEQLRVVSLGSFCGMKLSIQKLGLGGSHLPFDWIRSTSQGIRHFVDTGFQDYFSVTTKYTVPNSNLTMLRSERHSFWHDDITQAQVRQKLERRIERFKNMRKESQHLVFVRSCATTAELPELEMLHAALGKICASKEDPNRRVFLGIIIDGQSAFEGPFLNEDLPDIFIVRQSWHQLAVVAGPTYCEAVAAIVREALMASGCISASVHEPLTWTMSRSQGVILSRGEAEVPIQELDSGLMAGFGSLRCFETPGKQHVDCSRSSDGLGLPEEVMFNN